MLVLLFWLFPIVFAEPACEAPARRLLDHVFFRICYDSFLKSPLWTSYELRPEHLFHSLNRPSSFRPDPSLDSPSASNADFRGSTYSRGHLIPAADLAWSEAAFRATFYLTNVVAQKQSVNAGRWRQLENAVRRLAASADAVTIYTGALFALDSNEFVGQGRVAAPTHTYKVLLVVQAGRRTMFAAIIPNAANPPQPLNYFAVTVDEVERRTGLDFFEFLDDAEENALESRLQLFP
jgi:endonuclease G